MAKISAPIKTCVSGALALLDAGRVEDAAHVFRLALEAGKSTASRLDVRFVRWALNRYLRSERDYAKTNALRAILENDNPENCPIEFEFGHDDSSQSSQAFKH